MKLFIFGITVDLNDLHTIQQRPWDGLGSIGSRNEKNLRKIHGNLHIVIPESHILPTVKHLQKRGKSVPLIIVAHLIDFIQQHQWIFYACLL